MIDGSQVRFQDKIYGAPGGGSAVYTGEYTPLNADGGQDRFPVVIKQLALPANSGAFMEGIMQEVIIQSKLEACKYICKCYGLFIREGTVCIVMERLLHDLEQDIKLHTGSPYPEAQLTTWMFHVLEALDYARSKNIAHRDIKPQNILLTAERTIKLVDFGSGTIHDGKAQKLTGTPLYMSPEQHPMLQEYQRTGQLPQLSINPFKSDVYSLGVTFLQLALMEPPIQILTANREAALQEYLGSIRQSYPVLAYCLDYMLQNQPSQRPDIPELVNYLKNPENKVVMTLPQPQLSAVTPTEEPLQQCARCTQAFPVKDLMWTDQYYYMCSGCCAMMNERVQAAASVMPTPQETTPQGYTAIETAAPTEAPELTQSFMQVCQVCPFTTQVFVSQRGESVWFCSFCASAIRITFGN